MKDTLKEYLIATKIQRTKENVIDLEMHHVPLKLPPMIERIIS